MYPYSGLLIFICMISVLTISTEFATLRVRVTQYTILLPIGTIIVVPKYLTRRIASPTPIFLLQLNTG